MCACALGRVDTIPYIFTTNRIVSTQLVIIDLSVKINQAFNVLIVPAVVIAGVHTDKLRKPKIASLQFYQRHGLEASVTRPIAHAHTTGN